MDIHAHHSHKPPEKKFWHFFFEFFMLFIAVFCGFLAENVRERQVDHHREKQYMVTLIEDLKADTTEFRRLSTMCTNINSRRDSLITYMRPPIAKDKVLNYYIEMMWVTSLSSFSYNDRTTEQLKSAGAYRLIRKSNVADSIVAYDNKMRGVFSKNYNVMWDHRHELFSMLDEIVDLSAIKHIKTDSTNRLVLLEDGFKADALSRLQLITNDNEKLMKVYNACMDQTYFSLDLSNWVRRMNARAVSLIQLIEKEYHLE